LLLPVRLENHVLVVQQACVDFIGLHKRPAVPAQRIRAD
jgi:hypothetical protein